MLKQSLTALLLSACLTSLVFALVPRLPGGRAAADSAFTAMDAARESARGALSTAPVSASMTLDHASATKIAGASGTDRAPERGSAVEERATRESGTDDRSAVELYEFAATSDRSGRAISESDSGFELRGRVLSKEGKAPVVAATVVVVDSEQSSESQRVALTDESGAFEIAGLSEGAHRLKIRGDGLARTTQWVFVKGELREQEFVVEEERIVRGTVSNQSGQPVAGARIEVIDATGDRRVAGASDVDGTFEIDELGSSAVRVEVTKWKHSRWKSEGALEHDLDVTLTAGLGLSGLVIDESNQAPVPGALVLCSSDDPALGTFTFRTDEQGVFDIVGLSAGKWEITISATGFAKRSWDESIQSSLEGVVFPLSAGTTFFGRVVDSQGRPIMGVAVQLYSEGPNPEVRGVRTDRDGVFEVRALSHERYRGVLSHSDYAREGIEVEVGDGDGEYTLLRGGRLTGRVSRSGGKAAYGTVVLQQAHGSFATRADLDAKGRFSVNKLPPARYRIRMDGSAVVLDTVDVRSEELVHKELYALQ